MHELSLVRGLFDILDRQAKTNGIKKVTKVILSVGVYSTTEPSHLKSCLALVAKGSIFENAEFEIEKASGSEIGVVGMEGEC